PLSAYDVMAQMRDKYPKIAPPTVYRALAALMDAGQVHRMESKNAYIACQHNCSHAVPILSICDDCQTVRETAAPEITSQLSAVFAENGFAAQHQVIEIHGLCADCNKDQTL
ncbi:MAG: transcriptional repressor, partial [Pseudomonadota bacterium]